MNIIRFFSLLVLISFERCVNAETVVQNSTSVATHEFHKDGLKHDMKKQAHTRKWVTCFHDGRFWNYLNEWNLRRYVWHFSYYVTGLWDRISNFFAREPNTISVNPRKFEWPAHFDEVVVTPLGHASVLVVHKGRVIAVDPVFGDVGLTEHRNVPCSIDPESLPLVDVILITNIKEGHFDKDSVRRLKDRNPDVVILVPKGAKKLLNKLGMHHVQEYAWWQEETLYYDSGEEIVFTFVPAYYWSGSGKFDYNKTLWGGWVIQIAKEVIYVTGDTAYDKTLFKEIANNVPAITCLLVPISGSPSENGYMEGLSSVNSKGALMIFRDIVSRNSVRPVVIPIHWGVFGREADTLDQAREDFIRTFQGYGQYIRGLMIGSDVILHGEKLPELDVAK